jgi:hypothetical protein
MRCFAGKSYELPASQDDRRRDCGLLKRETSTVIKIGDLLVEAQEQLGARGQWLSWLNDNFYLSVRTAQRYLAASAFAREYVIVTHSLLSVGALYALIEADRDGHSEAVEAALDEAKVKWVDDDRVWEIVAELRLRCFGEASDEEPPSDAAKDETRPLDEASDEASASGEASDEASDEALGDEPEPDDDRPPPTPAPSLTRDKQRN